MTTIQLIQKEFSIIFPSILNNRNVELTADDIMNSPNSFLFEELNQLKGTPGIDEGEWEGLYNFLVLIDQCESSDAVIDIESEFNRFMDKYPGIRTVLYLKIFYTIMSVITGDVDGNKIIDFYKDVLENRPELVSLDDFFQRSNFLTSVLLLEEPSDELLKVIEIAVNNFPNKAILKFTLGRLYEMGNDIEKALDWYLQFLGQVESERIYNQSDDTYEYVGDYTNEDYHIALSSCCQLFYKVNNYNSAVEYSELCLKEFSRNGEDVYAFQSLFVDPMIIKLKVYVQQGSEKEFIKEFNLLMSKITNEEFQEEQFKEIVEFANELMM